ncbi:MAG: DegQ family serine endoprotease [Gallionellaceae bacterium]|nr:DegQ family serine endoprotease [Gallionellaceae bacterium]
MESSKPVSKKQPLLVIILIVAALAAGYVYLSRQPAPASGGVAAKTEAPALLPRNAITLPNFADIAEQEGRAVVNISASGPPMGGTGGAPLDFFHRFNTPSPHEDMPTQDQGSGFIVSTDGVILTNAHVVEGATEVTVRLADEREFKAKIIGSDKLTDVAVLRINAKDLPAVKIGDPQQSRVGEWVVAIGSPFGFDSSVTAGIISAKSRSLPDEGYVPFIQTDAAVNPGNSGGPLFNLNGEVIGINSQIYTRSGGYQGLSFAIPIDVAMKIEKQLLEHGKVSRGRLGITIQEVDPRLASSFGLDKAEGALVSSVEKDSPAEQAGIEAGDVIRKFNGKDVRHSNDLPPLVADVAPGTAATLDVWHKGKTRSMTVTVGEMGANTARAAQPASKNKLGLSVRPLMPDERREAGITDGSGVLVERASGPAMREGIQSGDIILSVNGEKISSVEQLNALTDGKNKQLALYIARDGSRLFVAITIK